MNKSEDIIYFINNYILSCFGQHKITLTDWEKDIIKSVFDNDKINKVWIVHNRKVGATTLCKLLHWFYVSSDTYICSHNLFWSNYIKKQMFFNLSNTFLKHDDKDRLGINGFIPMTANGIVHDLNKKLDNYNGLLVNLLYDKHEPITIDKEPSDLGCMYDGTFNEKTYNILNSYEWKLFTISVNIRDYDKIKPYIDADRNKENVIILEDDNLPLIKIINN